MIDATESSIVHVDSSVKTEPNDDDDYGNIVEPQDDDDEVDEKRESFTIIKSENMGLTTALSFSGSNQTKKTKEVLFHRQSYSSATRSPPLINWQPPFIA